MTSNLPTSSSDGGREREHFFRPQLGTYSKSDSVQGIFAIACLLRQMAPKRRKVAATAAKNNDTATSQASSVTVTGAGSSPTATGSTLDMDVIDMKRQLETEFWRIGHKSSVIEKLHMNYIDYGYRTTKTIHDTFLSLFTFHNETMNIWSHLIGCICVVCAGYHISSDMIASDNQTFVELIAFQSYIFCAALCLLLSTVYHWFGCMSESYHDCLLKMDITGVGLLVSGSFFPGIYYGFFCTPSIQQIHWGLTIFVFCVGVLVPWIELKVYGQPVRPFIMASLVVAGLIPFAHWWSITPEVFREEVTKEFLLMFMWYGLGFTLFVSKVPEKFFPKSFLATQVFASHFLWHCCVLSAVYVWFHFLLQYRELLREVGCSHHYDSSSSSNGSIQLADSYDGGGAIGDYMGCDMSTTPWTGNCTLTS